MYVVVHGEDNEKVDSRKEAVELAKDASRTARGRVKVLRDGGVERMFFRNGKLQEQAFVTPDRRQKHGLLS